LNIVGLLEAILRLSVALQALCDRQVMEQLRNFGDTGKMAFCVYCGRGTGTRNDVTSKVFPDEPYPTNLSCVPACQSCNEASSPPL
jgi:hypothetical protein